MNRLRRETAETVRRVLGGETIALTSYEKEVGVVLVPARELERLEKAESFAQEFIHEACTGEHPRLNPPREL